MKKGIGFLAGLAVVFISLMIRGQAVEISEFVYVEGRDPFPTEFERFRTGSELATIPAGSAFCLTDPSRRRAYEVRIIQGDPELPSEPGQKGKVIFSVLECSNPDPSNPSVCNLSNPSVCGEGIIKQFKLWVTRTDLDPVGVWPAKAVYLWRNPDERDQEQGRVRIFIQTEARSEGGGWGPLP